jgi:YHS domain-containing protein
MNTKTMSKHIFNLIAAASLGSAVFGAQTSEHKVLVLKTRDSVAVQGYDVVAYFTDHKAVQGSSKFSSEHEGAKYFFVNAEHKVLFDGNPAKYVPAYGGYCGYAASIDRLSPISPEWFQIIDGKLVLQHNKKAYDKFNSDLKGNIMKADENWPGLVARNGSGGKSLVFTNRKGVALEGYDPISYFTDGKPVKGDRKIEATYEGALYHFVSQAHRETFEKDPSKYAPAYGGFCGYAASIGKVRPANPLLWSIVNGRLIVQHTKSTVVLWEKDVPGNKAKADKNWPLLEEKKAGSKHPIDSLWGKSVLAQVN